MGGLFCEQGFGQLLVPTARPLPYSSGRRSGLHPDINDATQLVIAAAIVLALGYLGLTPMAVTFAKRRPRRIWGPGGTAGQEPAKVPVA